MRSFILWFYMDDKIIIKKLSELILDGNSAKFDEQAQKKFQISAQNIIRVRFGVNSTFYNDFMDTYKTKFHTDESLFKYNRRITELQTGVVEAILDALKNGLTDDLFYQRELLVFSDLLEQSFELLDHGLNLAAGTYGRVV